MMMDADAVVAHPQVFVEAGAQINFFVDPDVLGRPKLIRTLQNAGASIVTDPKTADFILVQSDTPSGQDFVRVWRADKIVLETTWVAKSISAGRPLKESDQWGGCLAVEDLSVALEDLDKNSLPTPRITPVGFGSNIRPSNTPIPPLDSYPPQPPHPLMNGHSYPNNNGPAIPLQHQQPVLHNQIPQFPPQPGVQQPPFLNFQGHQQFPGGFAIDPNVYGMVVMDIIQHGLLPAWGGPPGMQNGMPPGFLLPQGVGVNPMMQNPQTHFQPPGLIPSAHNHSASPSVSDRLSPSPSLSRRSSVDLKGKAKATSYVSRGPSGSFRPVAGSSASADKIFTSDSGEPLTFYVQIDVDRRTYIVSHIKNNGGQISTQTTADFAILAFRSKDFETLLETVLSSNGTAVKPAFVLESVQQNMLLDHNQYQYEVPPKLLRKVQKSAPRSPIKTDAEKKEAAKLRKANARKVKKEAAVKDERASPDLSRPRIPSPSPPPAHTRVLLNGDKYRYPEVEDDYVKSYTAILFDRDRQMSYTTLSAKLHAKMPHHSEKAWSHRIARTLRDDIEDIRKRAIIAYRKEQHQSQQTNAEEPPTKRAKLGESADTSQQVVAEDDVEQDLSAVAHFFANGGDEDQGEGEEDQSAKDARVWQKLTAKTACKTEVSWEVFYNKHHTKVMELYEILLAAQDGPGSTAQ
ncbi:hypothetical protein B0H19DRAFT_624767 [Mycena capillaripes]|nr:hypothetical protein B0H19DRAFT_624767 [Mycena capillaripes]